MFMLEAKSVWAVQYIHTGVRTVQKLHMNGPHRTFSTGSHRLHQLADSHHAEPKRRNLVGKFYLPMQRSLGR